MVEDGALADEHRCKRTDGRSWRCKRPVMEGKLLCEIHYVQGRFRNGKKRVPEALKLQRTARTSKKPRSDPPPPPPPASVAGDEGEDEIRVSGREHLDRKKKRKRSLVADTAEADNAAEDNTRAKAQELLKVFAKKETGRKKKNKAKSEEGTDKEKKRGRKKNVVVAADEQSGQEVTRDLPYGRMAISPMPEAVKEPETVLNGNADPSSVKLGLKPSNHRLVDRKFRSKNIERPPISTVKAVPFAANVKGKVGVAARRGRKRKCHWCQKHSNVDLIKCLTCKKKVFCSDCIKNRSIDAEEVKLRCPVCCGTCDCDACLASRPKDPKSEDILKKQCKFSKNLSLHYMITLLLPILEQINEEQRIELEMEAKLKGQCLSEVEIQRAEFDGKKKPASCNGCGSFILDMYRSCPKCSYNLCLSCCQEIRGLEPGDTEHSSRKKSVSAGNMQNEKKSVNKSKQNVGSLDSDSPASLPSLRTGSGNLHCASSELGGCGNSVLDLRCVFPLNYIKELEISAREIVLSYELPKLLEVSLQCALCSAMAKEGGSKKGLLEASRRKHPGDNFLYSPSIHDEYDILLIHFQKHWHNCHPVIIRDLLAKASGLAWDPIDMFSNYLKALLSGSENDKEACVSNCRDWYKVEFSSKESFTGSLLKAINSCSETLNLKAELSSDFCESIFPDHYMNILKALPIQEYTNPRSGLLNLAAMPAKGSEVLEYMPHIYIACGSDEEVRKGELVNPLSYSSYDLVNILVHASDFRPSTDEVNRIKSLIKMINTKDVGGCNGHDLDDRMIRERSEVTEEAGGQTNGNTEGTTPGRGMGDPSVAIVKDSIIKAQRSETGSDSSVMCSGTSDSPEKPIDDMSLVDPAETSTSERESSEEVPCGIQWDVFRKQDTPKLLEYVQRHSAEFYNPYRSSKKVIDPILDGDFFLDSAHKMKLKDEFKIEPWTFNQKLGEAVMIPAGCLYQMRNLKSCVNVVLGFVSPENAGECIKLTGKLQALPTDNRPKVSISRVEVEKMVINKISEAIREIQMAAKNQAS